MDISLARENRDPNIVVIDEDNQNLTDDNCSFEFGVKKKRKKDKLPERENGGPTVIDDEGIRMEQHQKSSKKVKSANLPIDIIICPQLTRAIFNYNFKIRIVNSFY